MSGDLGKDAQSVTVLQRKHITFQSDLNSLQVQVSQNKVTEIIYYHNL